MRFTILVAAGLLASGAAFAQGVAPSNEGGRYALERTEDGFLRLDRESGAVSHCRSVARNWVCETAADDREALEAEIERLTAENQTLRGGGDTAILPEPRDGERPSVELTLPSQEDVDRVVDFLGSVMQRLVQMVESFRDDVASDRT